MGQPTSVLERLPLPELQAYEAYTRTHGLPLWRIELQLARMAMLLDALRRPGASLSLSDYLIRPQADEPAPPDDLPPSPQQVDALCQSIGFSPRPRRPKHQPAPPHES